MTVNLSDAAIRSSVILALAWAAAWFMRGKAAELRVWIWRMALLASSAAFISIPLPDSVRIATTVFPAVIPLSPDIGSRASLLMAIWIAGVAALSVRLSLRLLALARLTRGSAASAEPGIRISDAISTPITWGVFHPVILLPAYVSSWPMEKCAAAIRHERAHIQRQDWLWQVTAELIVFVLWFSPLAWLASARLRAETEQAADDDVLSSGMDAGAYAGQLVEIARRANAFTVGAALAMVRHSGALEHRIHAILDSTRNRTGPSGPTRWAVFASAVTLVLLIAACQGARLYKVEQLETPPKVVTKVEPGYTAAAREAKIQGTALISVVIDPQGHARNIRVAKSLDKGLDQQAVDAIQKWQFSPGVKDGKPVRTAAKIAVNFRLR